MPERTRYSNLSYSQLMDLASRLFEECENVRNPAFARDLLQAARAVHDLAAIKFETEDAH